MSEFGMRKWFWGGCGGGFVEGVFRSECHSHAPHITNHLKDNACNYLIHCAANKYKCQGFREFAKSDNEINK